jgi:hypothetical protein
MSRYRVDYHRSTCQGGNGRIITNSPHFINNPLHDIDVAIVQAAFARITRVMHARRIDNDPNYAMTVRIRHIIKSCCRALGNSPFARMSKRQREVCLQQCSFDDKARFDAMMVAEPEVPLGLRYLPKKPPQRKVEEDT